VTARKLADFSPDLGHPAWVKIKRLNRLPALVQVPVCSPVQGNESLNTINVKANYLLNTFALFRHPLGTL
jgi:hypothetical protein